MILRVLEAGDPIEVVRVDVQRHLDLTKRGENGAVELRECGLRLRICLGDAGAWNALVHVPTEAGTDAVTIGQRGRLRRSAMAAVVLTGCSDTR